MTKENRHHVRGKLRLAKRLLQIVHEMRATFLADQAQLFGARLGKAHVLHRQADALRIKKAVRREPFASALLQIIRRTEHRGARLVADDPDRQAPPRRVRVPFDPLAGSWRTWVLPSGGVFLPPPHPPIGSPRFEQDLAELRALARPDTIVCRCEDVTAGRLAAVRDARGAALRPRRDRPVPGPVCGPALEYLFGWPPGPPRPPLAPVAIATLACPQPPIGAGGPGAQG